MAMKAMNATKGCCATNGDEGDEEAEALGDGGQGRRSEAARHEYQDDDEGCEGFISTKGNEDHEN